jgi:hypothetical protein
MVSMGSEPRILSSLDFREAIRGMDRIQTRFPKNIEKTQLRK